jgi:hypothetical protein
VKRWLALLLFAVSEVAQAQAGCDELRGLPITPNVSWTEQIKPILTSPIGPRCLSCHGFGGRPDLSDVGQEALYKLIPRYIKPGVPSESFLFAKINCQTPGQGVRMPLGGAPLSTDQQGLIYDWIRQGARGEDPQRPIYRDFLYADDWEALRR